MEGPPALEPGTVTGIQKMHIDAVDKHRPLLDYWQPFPRKAGIFS